MMSIGPIRLLGWRGLLTLISISLLAHCTTSGSSAPGGSGETATPVPLEISFSNVPEAQAPVGVINSNITHIVRESSSAKAATTGLKIGSINSTAFSGANSYMACEAAKHTLIGYDAITKGDAKLCIIKQILAGQDLAPRDVNDTTLIYAITGNDDIDLVQFSVTADATNGAVSAYTMHSCNDGVQIDYHLYGVANTVATINSVTKLSEGGFTGYHRTTVSGVHDGSGVFTGDKTIVGKAHALSTLGSTAFYSGTLTQSSSQLAFSGTSFVDIATRTNCSTSQTESGLKTQVFVAQLIDHNASSAVDSYNVGQLAIGDGAAVGSLVTTCDDEISQTATYLDSWDGDTRDSVTSNDYTSTVASATLPDAATVESTTFAGSEVIDCSAAATNATATVAAGTIDCSNRQGTSFSFPDCDNLDGLLGLVVGLTHNGNKLSLAIDSSDPWLVGLTDTIQLTFSRTVKVASLSGNVTLTDTTTNQTVSIGEPTVDATGKIASYTLSLVDDHTYTLQITTGSTGVVSTPGHAAINSLDGEAVTGNIFLYIKGDAEG